MNQIEYTALTTMITSIKAQISGLETMIATISNVKKDIDKPVPRKAPDFTDSVTLSDEDDLSLEKMIKEAQNAEIRRMASEAEKYGQNLMQNVIDTQEVLPDGQ